MESAIGDIAVCIVNAAKLNCYERYHQLKYIVPAVIVNMPGVLVGILESRYLYALENLSSISRYNFEDCLAKAWNEIKDRKGMMINGKYVKWDNLTDQQKDEFERRQQC